MSEGENISLENTAKVQELTSVPAEERDETWADSFLDIIPNAGMTCADPQIITGPDGMPYFALMTPDPDSEFQAYSLLDLLDFVMENGCGISVNPNEEKVDWVFTYGDLWNYKLTGEFYAEQEPAETNGTPNDEVMLAQPSESFLPTQVRNYISDVLKESFGIAEPAVLLLFDPNTSPPNNLVFNIFEEDLDSPEHFQGVINFISWSLPRHYGVLGVDKDSGILEHFNPL